MTRETPVLREATLAAGGAAALAALLVWLGPPGADLAEHAYQRTLFLNDGFAGGATRFHDFDVEVVPRTGMALLFQHALWHEGRLMRTRGTDGVWRFRA